MNQVPSEGRTEEECTNISIEEEDESGNAVVPRKKLRLSKDQSRLLEESFKHNHTLNPVSHLFLSPSFFLLGNSNDLPLCDIHVGF